jgi:hypothetical protein
MDTLDIFLKKYSYKFTKGYPDMNNEQDILLMENILNELGIDLEEAKTTIKQIQQMIMDTPGVEGKLSIPDSKYSKRMANVGGISNEEFIDILSKTFSLEPSEIKVIPPGSKDEISGKDKISGEFYSFRFNFKNQSNILTLAGKTRGEGIEAKELAYVNDLIEQNGGKIDIVLDDTVYPNITKAIKVPKNKQADFEFIGDNNLYIQHKDMVSQQLSGVHKLNLLDVEELTDDELTIVVKKYPEIQEFVKDVKALRPDGLVSKDNISRLISPKLQMEAAYGIGNEFGPSKVQAVFFGNLTLEPEQLDNEKTIFRLSSPAHFVFPTPLSKEYEVMITATFRNKMNQQGIKNARFGFYPKKVYPKTQMI